MAGGGAFAIVVRARCHSFSPWAWHEMDGAMFHSASPFCGQRSSIVLFLHDAVRRPLPASALANATALGLATTVGDVEVPYDHGEVRARGRPDDWRFRDAIAESAGATLHVAALSYDSLRRHVRGDDVQKAASPAFVAAPQKVLLFLLFA